MTDEMRRTHQADGPGVVGTDGAGTEIGRLGHYTFLRDFHVFGLPEPCPIYSACAGSRDRRGRPACPICAARVPIPKFAFGLAAFGVRTSGSRHEGNTRWDSRPRNFSPVGRGGVADPRRRSLQLHELTRAPPAARNRRPAQTLR